MEDRAIKRQAFLEHTKGALDRPHVLERFSSLKKHVELLFAERWAGRSLHVLDAGCGLGLQSMLWAQDGHKVVALDIDTDLLEIGKELAGRRQLDIQWLQGRVDKIPLPDESVDLCLCVELLEHVPNWEAALDEMARVLSPGGVVLLTTTNILCPKQNEFRLPLYSWWPSFAKRRVERLSQSTRPDLANFTDHPAVNWFSYYSLGQELRIRGFDVRDRLDAMVLDEKPFPITAIVTLARRIQPIRAVLYLAIAGTLLYAQKRAE